MSFNAATVVQTLAIRMQRRPLGQETRLEIKLKNFWHPSLVLYYYLAGSAKYAAAGGIVELMRNLGYLHFLR